MLLQFVYSNMTLEDYQVVDVGSSESNYPLSYLFMQCINYYVHV